MVMSTAAEQHTHTHTHTHKYNNIARYSRYAYLQVEILVTERVAPHACTRCGETWRIM